MEVEVSRLQELADEYGVEFTDVVDCYIAIKDIPCVLSRDEDSLFECMEYVIQDMVSNSFIKDRNKITRKGDIKPKSLEFSICDALCEVYGDNAISSLTEEYKEFKGFFIS